MMHVGRHVAGLMGAAVDGNWSSCLSYLAHRSSLPQLAQEKIYWNHSHAGPGSELPSVEYLSMTSLSCLAILLFPPYQPSAGLGKEQFPALPIQSTC
eukprot:2416402-Ditylum_brightwellii.AAC.1